MSLIARKLHEYGSDLVFREFSDAQSFKHRAVKDLGLLVLFSFRRLRRRLLLQLVGRWRARRGWWRRCRVGGRCTCTRSCRRISSTYLDRWKTWTLHDSQLGRPLNLGSTVKSPASNVVRLTVCDPTDHGLTRQRHRKTPNWQHLKFFRSILSVFIESAHLM